jgi:hypothetical protein
MILLPLYGFLVYVVSSSIFDLPSPVGRINADTHGRDSSYYIYERYHLYMKFQNR